MMGDFDPFDLLQEHDLMINRLIRAHKSGEKVIQAIVNSNNELLNTVQILNTRIDRLEQIIKKMNQETK